MKVTDSVWFFVLLFLQVQFLQSSQFNSMVDSEESMDVNESCNTRDFIIISTIDGMVAALDMKTGKKCWSVLLDAEKFLSSTLSELEVYENGHRVWLVPSLDGSLFKYDNYKIHPLPVDVDSLISHSAYLDASTNIIGGKVKAIFGIHRLTGEIIYTCKIDGCNSLKIPFPENILVVEEIIQLVNAIDSSKAQKKWHFRVVELKVNLASQGPSESSSEFYNSVEENALIPSFNEFISIDTYKVSLLNGFAGMIDKSSKKFSWLFKASCPINDAWLVKDSIVKMLDPFDKESGFFSMEMDDGKYSALLFLGTYQNQMFIKKSKKFPQKNMNFSSLSTRVLHYTSSFPVCSKSENVVSLKTPVSQDLVPANLYINVSEYGSYFYFNFSIAENATHCIINTSYIIQYDSRVDISYWFGVCVTIILLTVVLPVFIGALKSLNETKQYVNASTSSFELPISKQKEVTETAQEFRSRFHQDFELIAVLGKGGFGVVMDVKNKIDDCRYAVKRIRIHERFNSSQYEKLLREVKALAKLDHHGIVRYFNAWIEHPPIGWQEEKDIQSNICDISEGAVSSSYSSDAKSSLSCKQDVSSSSKVLYKLNQNPLLAFNDPFCFDENNVPNNDYQFSDYSTPDDSDNSSSSSVNKGQKIMPHYFNQGVQDQSKNSSVQNSKSFEEKYDSSEFTTSGKSLDEDISSSNKNITSHTSSIRFSENELPKEWLDKREINSIHQSNQENYNKSNFINNQIELPEKHAGCCIILRNLNDLLIRPIDYEMFNAFCTYFFHDVTVYRVSVIERSDWKKIIDITSKRELIYFQKWLICILCMIRSLKNFNCDIEIRNFCYILCDVTKRLNDSYYFKSGCLSNSDLEPSKYTVHFSLESANPDAAEERSRFFNDGRVSKKSAISLSERNHLQVAPGYLYIQMQLCQKESLRDWLNRNSTSRDYMKVMEIFCEIVDAVHYVHNCGLMHRDLKPSNIYFSMEGAIKIGDFGLATSSEIHGEKNEKTREFSQGHTSDIGTEFYMSPEQKLKQDYDCKTDIYSLGIILFELLVPFRTYSERYEVLSKIRYFKFPEEFKRDYQNESELVQQMLNNDPKNRPSTDEIKQHPLLLQFSLK